MLTNSPNSPEPSGLYYRLTPDEWNTVWQELKPTEIRILYHLRTLDPFGDRDLDVGVRELGRTLEVDHSTVSRALRTLDEKGYINLDLLQVRVRVNSKVVDSDTTGGSSHHPRSSDTTRDRQTPPQPKFETPEPLAESEPASLSTECDFVPEQTLKNSVKQNFGLTTVEIDREKTGTSSLAQIIPERAAVPLNAALISVVEEIEMRHPEESYNRVCNAITAYLEQQDSVRNPQAFISAALRRGFTSNGAKREKRNRKTGKQKRTNFPPAPLDLSGLIADIQIHCQRLGITVKQALERFGRAGRSLVELTDIDISTLRAEMAGW